jgi:CheY-like chemotaxis protein
MTRTGRLLVVDDNEATRYAVRRVLERHGYTVLEAGTGGEGLALIAAHEIDALVLDVNLPDMSGFDIVRKLRADPGTALLPVVHVSAASIETGDLITGLDAGADAYLIHPVDPDVLLATLRTLLRVRDTERALGESQARFREIFENVAAPIGVVDAQLGLRDANQALAQLLGDTGPGQLRGSVAPGQEKALAELRERLVAGERWHGAIDMQASSGLRETQWTLAPYQSPDIGIVFIEDATEQRQRERAQRQRLDSTEAALVQAQKMDALGQLTGGIAHDFNNLLTGIITGVELMNQRIEDGRLEGIHRFSDMVMASARSAAALTHRLLAFARQQPLDARPVDVNATVRSLADMLRRTIGERIALELALSGDPAIARADSNQLENAILNLVINARDALLQGGRVRIATDIVTMQDQADLRDGDYVALSVSDNGTGMPADVLAKAFEPFFTTKPQGHGTGLGLSMIYGFARQSGGHARIVSAPGQGTEVTLFLPISVDATLAGPTEKRALSRGGGEHVLLVEDMVSVRMVAAELLTQAGYRCTEAADADAALKVIRASGTIDLLLTDIGLPGMNGRELADLARSWRPRLPVLFMTGYAEKAAASGDFLGEREDMVIKPFEIDILLKKVRGMLALS